MLISNMLKNTSSDLISLLASGSTVGLTPVPNAFSVTKTGSYTGNGATQSINLGFASDFVVIASDAAEEAVFAGKGSWYSNTDFMYSVTPSSEAGATVTNIGFDLLSGLVNVNQSSIIYHYFAFKNNDSNTILHTSYQGNVTNGRTVDMLLGKTPLAVIEKRDGSYKAVYAALGETTVDPDHNSFATKMVIESDGKLTLDASNESNQWNGPSGEAMSTLAFLTSDNVHVGTYVGNATGGRSVSLPFLPDWILINAIGSTGFSGLMWFSSLSAGEHIPIGAGGVGIGRITSVSATEMILPNHNSTNQSGRTYVIRAAKANTTVTDPFNLSATKYNKEIQLTSGYINCGTSDTLKIDGPISIEWFGSISPASITAFASGTADTQLDKQYPLICRSDGADNRVDDASPTPNISFAIETTNSISPKAWVGSTITVASHNYWSLPDALPSTPPLDYYPMNTGRRIDQEGLVHIIAVHHGNGYWVIYENGVPVKERKRDLEAILGGTYPTIKNVQGGTGHTTVLGARKRVGATPEFDHDMKFRMARIYNTALTPTEARNNFLSTLNMADATVGFVEEWDARNASGTSLPASVNSANNGTIVNGTIVSV